MHEASRHRNAFDFVQLWRLAMRPGLQSCGRVFTRAMATKSVQPTKPDEARLQHLLSLKKPWQLRDKAADSNNGNCVPCGGSADAQSNELYKQFKFRNFREAWQFMSRVAAEAERLNHHPEWANVYNRVDVALTTHSAASSITNLDIELAEECEVAAVGILQARPPKA